MKKIFTVLFAGLLFSAQVMAVSVWDVCGQFDGNLNIGGDLYPNKSVYLLRGTVDNTVTFVLPDFSYNGGMLGNIVLPNIPISENGQLTLENATLYIKAIKERATITVLNGLEDEGTTYNSIVTASDAMVVLSIAAPSLPEPIFVLFTGKAANNNYALVNGGFEGTWTNNEPAGWHSFGTATGDFVNFVKNNTDQFVPSTQVRPGSNGTQSALLSSKMVLGAKANGNCTNGQINAGSTTADDPAANYNFSDPKNTGFNTPFQGRPDSIVFWAKYLPADKNPANEVNKARVSAIITTNARYQDPENPDSVYTDMKIAAAVTNYSATPELGWQRIAVPFAYYPNNLDKKPAYILTTFTTNMLPGGGSSYSTGTINKVNVLDTVYLDDAELIYNNRLTTLTRNESPVGFKDGAFSVDETYCDSCGTYSSQTNGVSTQTFFAFDHAHKCIFIYVIADDYAQSGRYSLYRVDFTDTNIEGTSLDTHEGIEGIFENKSNGAQKVLYNGQLYIRLGDAIYNVSGIRIQ